MFKLVPLTLGDGKIDPESVKTLIKDFAEVRSKIVSPKKDKVGVHGSKYATLDSVEKAVTNAERECGNKITHTQDVIVNRQDNTVSVVTVIMSVGGAMFVYSPLAMPIAQQNAQQYGSAETYARRYSLSAAYSIATEEDDDGDWGSGYDRNARSQPRQQYNRQPPQPPAPSREDVMARKRELSSEIFDLDQQHKQDVDMAKLTHIGETTLLSLISKQDYQTIQDWIGQAPDDASKAERQKSAHTIGEYYNKRQAMAEELNRLNGR